MMMNCPSVTGPTTRRRCIVCTHTLHTYTAHVAGLPDRSRRGAARTMGGSSGQSMYRVQQWPIWRVGPPICWAPGKTKTAAAHMQLAAQSLPDRRDHVDASAQRANHGNLPSRLNWPDDEHSLAHLPPPSGPLVAVAGEQERPLQPQFSLSLTLTLSCAQIP